MKIRKYARVLSAMVLFCGLGVGAKAEALGGISVTVPFAFVASGKTLPAGTYNVTRLTLTKSDLFWLTRRDTGASVLLVPSQGESARADTPEVTFLRVGDVRFLSMIQTGQNIYNLHVTHSAITEAATRSRSNNSVTVGSGDVVIR